MISFLNALLLLICCISVCVLVFQGFALPALSPFGRFALMVLAAVSGQWLVCRKARTPLQRSFPAVATSFFAVWGFFLLLTSPSWQHATFLGFLADYASPAVCCWAVWWLYRAYYNPR